MSKGSDLHELPCSRNLKNEKEYYDLVNLCHCKVSPQGKHIQMKNIKVLNTGNLKHLKQLHLPLTGLFDEIK